MHEPKLRYRNVTITGKIGVGKSTLRKGLEEALAPLGWKFFSAGEFQRQYMRERGVSELHGATYRPDARELEIEAMTKKRLTREDKWIYEAWLAAFIAQGIPGILKILVICSDDAIRIDRVANRDNLTIEDAKHWIRKREEENVLKWKKLYGDHDFFAPKLFDMTIDTYALSKDEARRQVLEKLRYFNNDARSKAQEAGK